MVSEITHDTADAAHGTDDEQQLVLFQLGGEDYGVDIYSV